MFGLLLETIDDFAIAALEIDVLAGYLQSLAHELVHYHGFKWANSPNGVL